MDSPLLKRVSDAFKKLKDALTSAPGLAYFDVTAPTCTTKVSVDASGYAIGGVPEQETATRIGIQLVFTADDSRRRRNRSVSMTEN